VLQSQGKFEAVEEMYRRALEGREKMLGRRPFHADERQQPGVGATQSVKAQSGRRNSESTSARREGKDVGEGVRRVSLLASFILMRRKGESRSKAGKRPEVEQEGNQK